MDPLSGSQLVGWADASLARPRWTTASEAGWVVAVALAGLNLELYREFLAALVVVVLLALLPAPAAGWTFLVLVQVPSVVVLGLFLDGEPEQFGDGTLGDLRALAARQRAVAATFALLSVPRLARRVILSASVWRFSAGCGALRQQSAPAPLSDLP